MRLVNVSTLQLEEFIPDKIPQYAILSHRWEETGEVLFSDFQNGTARRKAAWEKLEKSCEQAIKDELDYIWIDTCCIDKSSSAELSESINSMFSFYRHAKVCYAYLSDVSSDDDIRVPDSKFFKSLWFTRGWTLQELVAPRVVQFFFKDWKELGERYDLSDILSDITRIPEEVLDHSKSFDEFSIAQRMAWASQRNVTRSEDMAYCLMGLFDVNMPMLYGEGGVKAFIRLQEEIIKISDDTSIFAWVDSEAPLNVQSQVPHGLLATSIKLNSEEIIHIQ
ncbi:heterokaryon incompatibility protein-domain-containing protein [Penicillium angulare]|uniref:Heterokaryon incompatibility protein-domain-containing protein n=1 Tax=Penicillium angulare TaxID=116970 RepID=A0A9W9FZ98_9EURO|nr:heterokaryon incompatibility protein-domain-containing protein [Penicillium angulare]